MSTISRFEEIEAWQSVGQLTKSIYKVSSSSSFSRDFRLCDQMRRASVSILSKIAEGSESRTSGLFIELLRRAKGSAGELRVRLYVASDAGGLTPDQAYGLHQPCEKCSGQIRGFASYLRSFPKHVRTIGSRTSSYEPSNLRA